MAYEVLVTESFRVWYEDLSLEEQESIQYVVDLLIEAGPSLGFPYTSGIKGSQFPHMRELRIQHQGRPYRTLYAFDPVRRALLLVGGDKTGDERWYKKAIPLADRLYEKHLKELEK